MQRASRSTGNGENLGWSEPKVMNHYSRAALIRMSFEGGFEKRGVFNGSLNAKREAGKV